MSDIIMDSLFVVIGNVSKFLSPSLVHWISESLRGDVNE